MLFLNSERIIGDAKAQLRKTEAMVQGRMEFQHSLDVDRQVTCGIRHGSREKCSGRCNEKGASMPSVLTRENACKLLPRTAGETIPYLKKNPACWYIGHVSGGHVTRRKSTTSSAKDHLAEKKRSVCSMAGNIPP